MGNHNERSHAPFGGSVASRRINCTGSYFIEIDAPELPNTEDALEGTKAHEVCEYELARFLYYKVHGEFPDLPEPKHHKEFLEVANGYVKAIWEEGLDQSITGKEYTIEDVLIIDKSLGMYGPADFACVYNDARGRLVGLVVDFKYGFNFVSCESNDQLSHYACGLRESIRRNGRDLHYVRAAIYQPRAGAPFYREHTYSGKYLDTWKRRAIKAASTIFVDQKPKFKVGPWCEHCRGKKLSLCPTYAKAASKLAQLELVDYKTVELPTVETLTNEQITRLVLASGQIEAVIKGAKLRAMTNCLNGGHPGLKVVEGNGKRGWIKDQEKILETLGATGLDSETLTEPKLLGLGKIEPQLKKKVGDDEAQKILSELAPKSTPKVLVPDSDPRPAVTSSKDLLEEMGD